MKCERKYINPIEAMKGMGWPKRDFIKFCPDFKEVKRKPTHWRHQRAGHDGTEVFTYEALGKLLLPIANMTNFNKRSLSHLAPNSIVDSIEYTLSPIRHASIIGVPINQFVRVGVRESFLVFIQCRYLDENGHELT